MVSAWQEQQQLAGIRLGGPATATPGRRGRSVPANPRGASRTLRTAGNGPGQRFVGTALAGRVTGAAEPHQAPRPLERWLSWASVLQLANCVLVAGAAGRQGQSAFGDS